jgi:hypothetical protein
MEWWIVTGLVLAAVAWGLANRLRKWRRNTVARGDKTIYPLW